MHDGGRPRGGGKNGGRGNGGGATEGSWILPGSFSELFESCAPRLDSLSEGFTGIHESLLGDSRGIDSRRDSQEYNRQKVHFIVKSENFGISLRAQFSATCEPVSMGPGVLESFPCVYSSYNDNDIRLAAECGGGRETTATPGDNHQTDPGTIFDSTPRSPRPVRRF